MKKQKRDYIAKLVIYDLPTMKKKELLKLANWISNVATSVRNMNKEDYSKRFTAKLMK